MPKHYPREFRRKVLDLLEGGRTVQQLARDFQISDQTIYNWRRQDRIDAGLELEPTSWQIAELAEARRRITALKNELARTRRMIEVLQEQVGAERHGEVAAVTAEEGCRCRRSIPDQRG